MRSPEYVNRYVTPQPAANAGVVGRLAQPCIIRVPKGAVAVVSLYAVVTSPSVSDPVVGWPSM
ncbi:hypothetical protein, partial [Hyalangium versicolor]|uniref:hypothetical protein n=1 Tax=Hyalangium versicolor TaxID=2861190 RepID=UPI001CCFF550